MPAYGIYISDHRHKIQAIGSEGRSLRIEGYLEYFKKRVFAGLGISGVDMGEGDTANRATAQTLSKGAVLDIEALQKRMKTFIEYYIFDELLREGPFDITRLTQADRVEIKFGVIDKEERTKLENQVIQLFSNKLIDETEARKMLGLPPMDEDQRSGTYFKLYEEPLALLKALGMPAADLALAESPVSPITKEGVAQQREEGTSPRKSGRPENPSSTGQARASAAKARPSNQYGTRSGPKLDVLIADIKQSSRSAIERIAIESIEKLPTACDKAELENIIDSLHRDYIAEVDKISQSIQKQIDLFKSTGIKESTILSNVSWRFEELDSRFYSASSNRIISLLKDN